MRAVPTWVDKVHDRDRNEQVIMYLIYFAMHSAGGRFKKLGVQTILMNMSYVEACMSFLAVSWHPHLYFGGSV